MMHPTQAPSSVMRRGFFAGALKGALVGVAIGAAAAVALQFVLLPGLALIPGVAGITQVFAGFLTLTPGAAGAVFSPVPLMAFNGVLSSLMGAYQGMQAAASDHAHQQHEQQQEARIGRLEGRGQMLEHAVPQHSRAVESILARGPRAQGSHAEAEEHREPSRGPTIH